jgi:hypothetical protein
LDVRIYGKAEVSGNLIAVALAGRIGVRVIYGEYVEGELSGGEAKALWHLWDLGGVRRRSAGGVFEFATAYGDSALYSIKGFSGVLKGVFRARGFSGVEEGGGGAFAVKHEGDRFWMWSDKPLRISAGPGGALAELEVDGGARVAFAGDLDGLRAAMRGEAAMEAERRAWASRLLEKASDLGDPTLRYCWYVLLTNRCSLRGHPALRAPFTMPSKYVFRHQWLWDSSFHAIVLSRYDPRLAAEELENLFSNQAPDGRIPHEIFMSREACKSFWGVDGYTPWTTQPPVLAVAVDAVLSKAWDEGFAKRALSALVKYDEWFRAARDKDGDWLYSYLDPYETGWDDSPRWDEAVEGYRAGRRRCGYERCSMAPVEAVDLNSLIYLQRRIAARLAERLGDRETAEEYNEMAEKTAEAIRGLMWDEEDGFFYDVYEDAHEKIRVKTPAAFVALFAGVATAEQAEALVGHIFSPREFWTAFPIPSVSADERVYDPAGYWRGRSWINLIWFAYKGLRKYGYYAEASRLFARALEVFAKAPCRENYNSATGEPMGAPDFGWSTLIIDMALEERGLPCL